MIGSGHCRTTHRRIVLGLVASMSWASSASADERDVPISGAAYLGGYYGFGAGDRVDYDSSQYPTFGGFVDSEFVRFSGETPFPFLLVDLAATLIMFAAGEDDGVPIFEALNGDQEPGRFRLFDLHAAAHIFRRGPHAIDLGLHAEFSLLKAYLGEEPLGRSTFDLAPTLGYSLGTSHVFVAAMLRAGNGFGSDQTGNPFVGSSLLGMVRVDDWFGITLHHDVTIQHMNLESDDVETRRDGSEGLEEWAAFGATTFGLAWFAR